MNAAAANARHPRARPGLPRRAALAACTAALHAVTALCQSSHHWLDILIISLLMYSDSSWYWLAGSSGSSTAGGGYASSGESSARVDGRVDWRVTVALLSVMRTITPEAHATTVQYLLGALDLCSLPARLLLPPRCQACGTLALALLVAALHFYLTRGSASVGEAQTQRPQTAPGQRQEAAGSSGADSAAGRVATGGAARGAAHLLFALCYWVPAGRAAAALLAVPIRYAISAWRLVTRSRHSAPHAAPWPLLPAVLAAAALEQWAWQATAGNAALDSPWTDNALRVLVPPEEAGCWPLPLLQRILQLAVIQLSGQPAAAVLGEPPFLLPFSFRLFSVVKKLARVEGEDSNAQAAEMEADLRVNTFSHAINGFALCVLIVLQLKLCCTVLLRAAGRLVTQTAQRFWSPAGTAAAAPAGDTSISGGRGGAEVAEAALVFSAAGQGEQGSVPWAHGSRQQHRQPQGHHEQPQPQPQPGLSGTAVSSPSPADRLNRAGASADAAGQAAPSGVASPAQQHGTVGTATVRISSPTPGQPQPEHGAGQAIRSAVATAPAQPEEPAEPAVEEPPVPPAGAAVKQCAACGALRGEGDRKLRKCSSCMVVRYCSPECAKQHWPVHKPLCKQLQQQRREQQHHQ